MTKFINLFIIFSLVLSNLQAYKKKDDGTIWVKDLLHKDHWEVYKDKKSYEKGKRSFDVWEDGRFKGDIK